MSDLREKVKNSVTYYKDMKDPDKGFYPPVLSDYEIDEIISMVLDEAIEAVNNSYIGVNPNGLMRFGANEAIKAIEQLKEKDNE